MLKQVQQPLDALSSALDNMLLYMQYQRGLQLTYELQALPVASNWLSTWSQATALFQQEDTHRTQLQLCSQVQSTPVAKPVTGPLPVFEDKSILQWEQYDSDMALEQKASIDFMSHVTQATLQQVFLNLMSSCLCRFLWS